MSGRLRTLSVYRQVIERLGTFRVVSPSINDHILARVGVVELAEGYSILPKVVGPATSFNAEGKDIVRKDLPIETKSRMIHTSWKDWHGQTHSGTQVRDYKAYPRDLIPPPSEYVTAMRRGETLVLASRELSTETEEAEIVNVLKVFLELFGTIDIVTSSLDSPAPLKVQKLNWKILPPGTYPFDRASKALQEYLERISESDREVVKERIRDITKHNPDFLAIGIGGFGDYVVFGFSDKRRFVLESPNSGNATYIFRDDWEQFARLSKAEIIQGNLQEERIIHTRRWASALRVAISKP
jgi:hypothetical protein